MFINNLAYEASAGSGKTFMLVVRYLSLLFMGASPSKILALTFTNKAANEMRERVVNTLEDLQTKGELDEIIKITSLTKDEILGSRQKILEDFLDSNTKIMTIDAFFTQILRKFSLYVSLMPDFSTSASQHEIKLLLRFLKQTTVKQKKDLLVDLSIESDKRVTNIFALLDEFYAKKNEMTHLEFQKSDTKIFEDMVMKNFYMLQEIVYNSPTASSSAKKGVTTDSFDELRQKAWLSRDTLDYSTFKKCYTPQMDILLAKIKEGIKNYNKAKENNFFYALTQLRDIYEDAKKALYTQEGELGFLDVSILVYKILQEIDESDFLYFRLDAQIQHILLDEFQDTSILQYKILKPLIDEVTSGYGVEEQRSFFFVGDVKQSIYRFRGGVSALFEATALEQNTKIDKLSVNYRSKKEVVEFVNETFLNKIKNYTPQKVQDGIGGGFVAVCEDDEILDKMLQWTKEMIGLGANTDDIAILCFTNTDGETIKEKLQSNNIDVLTQTSTKLINQTNIKAIIEYLKYLYFKEDIYRYNFFALIKQKVADIQYTDISSLSLFQIVKNIITKYSLFNNDYNTLRFLSAVAQYKDIESFLFEYERLDTEASPTDLKGVKVSTIHKSKGLEYKHVIVIDRLKNPPPSRDTIIYEYDNITLKNVYLRIKGRENIDKDYADALKKDKSLQQDDNLNALYVAFTRAKESLIVIQKSKKSAFEQLELQPAQRGEVEISIQKRETKQTQPPLPYADIYYGSQSDTGHNEKEQDGELKSINFGIAMHYALEMLGSFEVSSINNSIDMMLNKYGHILDEDEIQDIKNRLTMLINSPAFRDLLGDKHYKEKAIKHNNNLKYIDLLVSEQNRFRIIDYKSSTTHMDKHIKQVKYYTKAIKDITGKEAKGYLCYMLKEKILIKEI